MQKDLLFNCQNKWVISPIICLLLFIALPLKARNKNILAQLDSFIKKREYYVELKERQLDLLKASAKSCNDDMKRLKLYNEIYDNYNSFVYDSAMTYVNEKHSSHNCALNTTSPYTECMAYGANIAPTVNMLHNTKH